MSFGGVEDCEIPEMIIRKIKKVMFKKEYADAFQDGLEQQGRNTGYWQVINELLEKEIETLDF